MYQGAPRDVHKYLFFVIESWILELKASWKSCGSDLVLHFVDEERKLNNDSVIAKVKMNSTTGTITGKSFWSNRVETGLCLQSKNTNFHDLAYCSIAVV